MDRGVHPHSEGLGGRQCAFVRPLTPPWAPQRSGLRVPIHPTAVASPYTPLGEYSIVDDGGTDLAGSPVSIAGAAAVNASPSLAPTGRRRAQDVDAGYHAVTKFGAELLEQADAEEAKLGGPRR